MRSLRLILTACLTFLFVINAVFWRKAIAVLLSGIDKVRCRLAAGVVSFLLVLLISLSGQPSWSSGVTGKVIGDPPNLAYTCNGKRYLVKVLPIQPINSPADSILIAQQKSLLEATNMPALQRFQFVPAEKLLDASFSVYEYHPAKKFEATNCSDPENDDVGADIRVEYKAKSGLLSGTDPIFSLHWIQVVTDSVENVAIRPGDTVATIHPPGEAFLDVGDPTSLTDPYYPGVINTDPLNHILMVDTPRHAATRTHIWKAQLYLVKEGVTIPKVVSDSTAIPGVSIKKTTIVGIYNGIEWGYEVTVDEKDAPCNQPNEQSKAENKETPQFCIATARSSNDPHLVTFDGLKYDLQTVGEVILIKSRNGSFEVQARQAPYNNSGALAINSAVAIKAGSDRIALYTQGLPDADTTTPLRVNGKPTTIQGDKLSLTGGGEIVRQGGNYVISAPTGEKVLVSSNGSFLNLSPIVNNRAGKYSGLLGNVNGNPKDDLQIRGGKSVLEARSTYGDVKQVVNLVGLRLPGVLDRAEQVYFDQLYKEFADSWRVKPEESLFDYPPGKTTKSYLNPGFPDKYLTLNMLSADQIQKAQNACTEAKVTEDLMEGCIFDVGFSGFSEFARATAEISGYIGIVNQLIPGLNIPTPNQVVDQIIKRRPKICVFGACL